MKSWGPMWSQERSMGPVPCRIFGDLWDFLEFLFSIRNMRSHVWLWETYGTGPMYSCKRPMGPVPCMAPRQTWDRSHRSIGTSHYDVPGDWDIVSKLVILNSVFTRTQDARQTPGFKMFRCRTIKIQVCLLSRFVWKQLNWNVPIDFHNARKAFLQTFHLIFFFMDLLKIWQMIKLSLQTDFS